MRYINLHFTLVYFTLTFGLLTLVKTRCLKESVGHLEQKFQGKGSSLGNIFLVCTKLDTFCYPTVQTASCYVPSF